MNRQTIKKIVPRGMIPALEKFYCSYKGLQDHWRVKNAPISPVPPAHLRYQVGSVDFFEFLEIGRKCKEDMEEALAKQGKSFSSFSSILDFGCGCGRTLLWLKPISKTVPLHGTDVNVEAVRWCQNAIPFARFDTNAPKPPLNFGSGTLDFVYAISVFTHLDEEYQFSWLKELKRIVQPGGFVLLSVHGESVWKTLPPLEIAQLKNKGIFYKQSRALNSVFPKFYKNTYHTPEYICHHWSKYFKILDYIPRGMNAHQDLIVFKKTR